MYIHRIRYANRNTFYKFSKITKEKKKKHFNKRNLVNQHQLELKKKNEEELTNDQTIGENRKK